MKALDEYFLMVVFTLLLNKLHVFAIYIFSFERKNMAAQTKDADFNSLIKRLLNLDQ